MTKDRFRQKKYHDKGKNSDITNGEDALPFETYYGDGDPIEVEYLELINHLYEKHKISFPWEKGDIVILDNMAMAHSRMPYDGDRKILVAMMGPFKGSKNE